MLWFLLSWLVYGLVVGILAKIVVSFFFSENDVNGFWPTVLVGVIGSYVGGGVEFLLGRSYSLTPAGVVMGVAGASVALLGYHYAKQKNFL